MKRSLKWAGQTGCLTVCLLAVLAAPSLAAARLELISVSTTGGQGNGDSAPRDYTQLGVSADGRFVAFTSVATNLVPDDTNGVEDILVRDRLLGVTERVSVGSGGEQANGPSVCCTISGDGRFVAFASVASNLVPGDLHGSCGAFVHDRATGITELVSVSTTGEPGNGISGPEVVISADGRFVVFGSSATNLTPEYYEYVPWDWHLYLRDRLAGTTELISVDPAGLPLQGRCTRAAISADGRLIAFWLEFQTGGNDSLGPHMGSDVLLRDREARTTEVVTLTETGEAPDGSFAYPGSMSGDGRFIAFVSDATNLAPETVYTGGWGLFVRDRVAGTLECAGEGLFAMITGDGRTVAFTSSGGDWLSLWNRRTGSIENMCCFFVSSDGRGVDDPCVSHDGRVVAFSSLGAPEIGPVDTNNARDVFVWEPLLPDIDYGDWASDGIRACAKWGIIVGYPDGLYHPELEVTRDQMAVSIARALVWGADDRIPDPAPPPTFSDVPADHWAYKHIEYAVSQNIVDGYEDGTYQPSLVVDRGQMAVYLARALVAPTGEAAIADPEPPFTFPDVPGEDNAWSWCLKHVEYLAGMGLVNGYDDGLYHPEYVVTRDQIAAVIARAFNLITITGFEFRYVP